MESIALVHPSTTSNPQPLPVPRPELVIRECVGDEVVTWRRKADGSVLAPGPRGPEAGGPHRLRQAVSSYLVPDNLSQAVSQDYVATRCWQLTRDFLGAFAGMASLAAVMTAVGPANAALAGLSVAGLTVANANWLKDRIGQLSGLAATRIARVAEKNPKAWMLAADAVNNLATVVDASTVLLPPIAYFPLLSALAVVRAVAGAAGGAAGANVAPRQALRGNLGEVSVKNSNQSTLATFAGATAGAAALAGLSALVGFGPAAMAVSTVGALAGLGAYCMMLRSLHYDPVNERAMRRVVGSVLDQQGPVPGPDGLLRQLTGLTTADRLTVGNRVQPLVERKDFEALRQLFKDRPYIVAIQDGSPYVVLKRDFLGSERPGGAACTDRMAAVQAAYQALCAERLLATPEYADRARRQGSESADRWVLEESLAQTPGDIRSFLQRMQDAGWSVDMVRFWGEDRPVVLEPARPARALQGTPQG